jgi:chloride channel protein, CIC family
MAERDEPSAPADGRRSEPAPRPSVLTPLPASSGRPSVGSGVPSRRGAGRAGALRRLLSILGPGAAPLDLQILGRVLLHAAVVGAAAGLIGAGFFALLELTQHVLLEQLAGYTPLRAYGEKIAGGGRQPIFRPWLLLVLPAVGALLSGLVTQLAPETRGGGGDATIKAFHQHGGVMRRRVIGIKTLASVLTLGSGGSGGREGPTMQIGGALGSFVGRVLRVGPVERRVLMVAGVAAGISAVFRTPLGAALLAVEILYRDDFEAEALIPAVLASVVSYSVVISIFGESILFAHAPRYEFVPVHMPLYAMMAVLVSIVAVVFVKLLRAVQRTSARLPVPEWARPAVGGLALGLLAVPVVYLAGNVRGTAGAGLGILGGGYGAAQVAITGADWLPAGWKAVQLLVLLGAAKLVATTLTIGTSGSAGDFGPSLVLGSLFGGAFGHAARILTNDARIDPGAFALVGMAAFYGGIAHVPLSALILVCELAGSYDLLVPLMLAGGIAFVALRKHSLYEAQVPTRQHSPAHYVEPDLDVLQAVIVGDVLVRDRPFVQFDPKTPMSEILQRATSATWQQVFPVVDEAGTLRGLITADTLRFVAAEREVEAWTIAADVAEPPVVVKSEADLRSAAELLLTSGLRQLPVVENGVVIAGFLDELDVSRAYLDATAPGEAPDAPGPGQGGGAGG